MRKTTVICGAVVLVALIAAGTYLYNRHLNERLEQAKIEQQTSELQTKRLKYQQCEEDNRAYLQSKSKIDAYASGLTPKNCDSML